MWKMMVDKEEFTQQERELLEPFVTNLGRSVFGLQNLPEVVKGALFSRYSRSDKSLRRILLDEFIDTSPLTPLLLEEGKSGESQAEAFYDRVLLGYGDDSVAELGGAHIACEGISNIAAKALEDSRIGISPLEKSTRYVPFNRKVGGCYRYYREPSIIASCHAQVYEATLDRLFDTYTALFDPLLQWVQACTPRDTNTTGRAYNSATKAKTFDLLRGLLPMATLTNVGLYANGRAFEYLLVKLAASPHGEVRTLGVSMQEELDRIIPSFVKRAKTERGAKYSQYLSTNYRQTKHLSQKLLGNIESTLTETVQLVEYDREAEIKVVAAILYPHTDLTFKQVRDYVTQLPQIERIDIINTYVGERESRFHCPGRAFEETYYTFDILADLGAYRDLHRHRILTQERQHYSVRHGYVVPIELEEANLAQSYRNALDYAAQTYEIISQELPDAAQYIVPFAYQIRWRIKLNLREAYHFIELRSSRQGHPSYRTIAQEMYRHIQGVHPSLAAGMSFVDLNDYALERLAAEQKIDVKLQLREI